MLRLRSTIHQMQEKYQAVNDFNCNYKTSILHSPPVRWKSNDDMLSHGGGSYSRHDVIAGSSVSGRGGGGGQPMARRSSENALNDEPYLTEAAGPLDDPAGNNDGTKPAAGKHANQRMVSWFGRSRKNNPWVRKRRKKSEYKRYKMWLNLVMLR